MPIFKARPEWTIGENLPQVSNQVLGNGIKGNLDTVKIMRGVARDRSRHPLIRSLAHSIIQYKNIPDHFYLNEAIAIADFVKKNVRYVRDIQGVETLTDPITLIDQIKRGEAQGDCDDMALLIATLLLSIGVQPFYRIVKYKGASGPFKHIYVVVYEKNPNMKKKVRIALDAIMKNKKISYEVPHKFGKEFKI